MLGGHVFDPPSAILEKIQSASDLENVFPEIYQDLLNKTLPQNALPVVERSARTQHGLLVSDAPCVCFLGKTGSGKTSLVNALLGCELLPAMDTGAAVTSSVTEISNDPSLADGSLALMPSMCSREEWDEKKRFLVEVLSGGVEDTGSTAEEEMTEIARTVLSAACPDMPVGDVQASTPECNEFLQRLNVDQREPVTLSSAGEAQAWLKNWLHLADSEDVIQSLLTSKVCISGKFEHIPVGVKIVDLPGLEDSNLLRSSVAERYFALFCNHAWFCLPRADGRILSNRGLARQIRTLARGGNLNNVLVIRTRADEAARKTTAALDREHEQFKKMCVDELRLLVAASSPGEQGSGSRERADEPPQSRRRLSDGSAVAGGGNVADVNFSGYVLATAAPAVEDMPAETDIGAVINKLQHVGENEKTKLTDLVRAIYQDAHNIIVEAAEEEARRQAEEMQRREREQEEARQRALAEEAALEAARQQAAEQARQREIAQAAAEEAARQREEEEARERARAQEAADVAARQQAAEAVRQQRVQLLMGFRSAQASCVSRIQNFRAAILRCNVESISAAIVSELRRAKPPNGQTLRSLIVAGGTYTSPTRGTFDLTETFCGITRVASQELPSAYSGLVRAVDAELREVQGLPSNLRQVFEMQLQRAQRQLNAVTTTGGPIRRLLQNVLRWPGGKGASDAAIDGAGRRLQERIAPTLEVIADTLAGTLEQALSSLEGQVLARVRMCDGSAIEQGQPMEVGSTCIICQNAPAVTRAEFVICRCSPRPPYACWSCVPRINLQSRVCPMCRGNSTHGTRGGG